MQIYFTQRFKKRFAKLPVKIQSQFGKRIDLFLENPNHQQLQNHPLKGNLAGLRAIAITGDYRMIFKIIGRDSIKLIDIGTHNQVY